MLPRRIRRLRTALERDTVAPRVVPSTPLRYGIVAPPTRHVWAAIRYNIEDTHFLSVPEDLVAYYNGSPPDYVRLARPLPKKFDGMKRMMQADLGGETFGVYFRKSDDLKRLRISLESTRSPNIDDPRSIRSVCRAMNDFLNGFVAELGSCIDANKPTARMEAAALVTDAYRHPDLRRPVDTKGMMYP